MSTNTLLFGVLFLLAAIIIFLVIRMELRLQKLFRGSKAQTLETLMSDIAEQVKTLTTNTAEQSEGLKTLEGRLRKHGRGVKLVRFNPFADAGSNQSFAVAIINEDGDGVVFSSLYSRERMSVFAKQIANGKSDIELTPEEQSVVEDAHKDTLN